MLFAGVLFDLDNSLVDRDGAFDRWVGTLGLCPGEASELRALDDSGRAPRHLVCRWLAARRPDLGSAEEVWDAMRAGVAAAVVESPSVRTAVRCLARLARVGVVTNGGGPNQREKLRRAGLDQLFSKVIISEEVGVAKPDRAIFSLGLASLGTEPRETLFVGDNAVVDIAGARDVGLATCWVARGRDRTEIDATMIIDRIQELPGALAR